MFLFLIEPSPIYSHFASKVKSKTPNERIRREEGSERRRGKKVQGEKVGEEIEPLSVSKGTGKARCGETSVTRVTSKNCAFGSISSSSSTIRPNVQIHTSIPLPPLYIPLPLPPFYTLEINLPMTASPISSCSSSGTGNSPGNFSGSVMT